eukprot:576131-Lingulodinium_polyedra.AAC.1
MANDVANDVHCPLSTWRADETNDHCACAECTGAVLCSDNAHPCCAFVLAGALARRTCTRDQD